MVWFILFWIACSIAAAGAHNAYYRGEFSYIRHSDKEGWMNLWASIGFSIMGPIFLFMLIFLTGCFWHGWTLRWRSEND